MRLSAPSMRFFPTDMERITSRKNRIITHIKKLSADSSYRRECGEYICEGVKFLQEAVASGAEICCVLWSDKARNVFEPVGALCCCAESELVEYASFLKNSPGPVFSVRMPLREREKAQTAIVLETVQDPGNVGTVIRTACAFGIDEVLLCGQCADLYNPKTVRATMGAIFRQRVFEVGFDELKTLGLPLYGAAFSDTARDIRSFGLGERTCAVAIGSEGRGLSQELLSLCDGQIIIPMRPGSESLNAAVAAALVMWEMQRDTLG